MSKIFDFYFWFDKFPDAFNKTALIVFLAVFGLLFLFAVYCFWHQSAKSLTGVQRKLYNKLGNWSICFSVLGLALVFFKYEMIPYFGMRLWLPLWVVICLVWAGFIVKYIKFEAPAALAESERRKALQKYLP